MHDITEPQAVVLSQDLTVEYYHLICAPLKAS